MKTFVEQDHYEFLGVEPDAGVEEIRRAVAKLREMFAPGSIALYSLIDQEEHKAVLARLEEAAVVLTDERARQAYDERHGLGRKAPEPPRKGRPQHPEQLELTEIVGAVDGAPAWPGIRGSADAPPAGPALEAAPIETSGPLVTAAEVVEAALARANVAEAPVAAPAPEPAPAGEPDEFDVDIDEPVAAAPAEPVALARVRPPEPPPPALPPMPELGPNTEFTGELLRRIREARGLTLRELATKTRISLGHLEHLEAEAFGKLPERVYLRGFLTAYAREFKLDGARLAETYLARWAAARRE